MKPGLAACASLALGLLCAGSACRHLRPQEASLAALEGLSVDLWTDGTHLFAWGEVEGQKARVLFSSTALGNFLKKDERCTAGADKGELLVHAGQESALKHLESWALEGKAQGGLEVAWVETWPGPTPSPSKPRRLRDGFELEADDAPCLLLIGLQQLGGLQLLFEGGRLQFEGASYVAQGERIRFEEHPRLGIPLGQVMLEAGGQKIPLRLVLETSQWSSHLHQNAQQSLSGKGASEGFFAWEVLWLSLKTGLPAGHVAFGEFAQLNAYWPWADGSLGMQAFACCRLVWLPRESSAVVLDQF